MEAGGEGRLRSTLGVFGTAFRNRSLLLVELAWLAFNSAEWGVWLALTVWAYVHGGGAREFEAARAGLVAIRDAQVADLDARLTAMSETLEGVTPDIEALE